jgi:hypothetical protein
MNHFKEISHLLRRVLPQTTCTCGGYLRIQETVWGDPEGIRRDKKCVVCDQPWGVSKSGMHKLIRR